MWLLFAVLSSLLLGGYDILKKSSLKGNAVLPVLFVAACSGAFLFLPALLFSCFTPEWARSQGFSLVILTPREHLWVFLKSVLVGASWILNYYAMKYLPLTTVSPIRSTGPLWTVMGALSFPDSLISIVSAVRRTSVVVPFLAGIFLFQEKRNLLPKVIALAGMVLGVLLIALGTR
ncbi:MAG: EamA family transporter [Bacteroidales bacterium]